MNQLTSIVNNIQDYSIYNLYPKYTAEFLDKGIYESHTPVDSQCITRGAYSDIGAYEYESNRNIPLFYVNPDTVTAITFSNLCNLTTLPTHAPTILPSINPSITPTSYPTNTPTVSPSINPSITPTSHPTTYVYYM